MLFDEINEGFRTIETSMLPAGKKVALFCSKHFDCLKFFTNLNASQPNNIEINTKLLKNLSTVVKFHKTLFILVLGVRNIALASFHINFCSFLTNTR